MQLVCFELRGQELALPIGDVRETLPIQPITRVVLTPPCLAGVFSLRGDIVPVIDLAILLGMPRTEHLGGSLSAAPAGGRGPGLDPSRIVVTQHEGQPIGIIVEALRDLRTIEGPLEPPPGNLPPAVAALLAGIVSTPTGSVRVLDPAAIFAVDALRVLALVPGARSLERGPSA